MSGLHVSPSQFRYCQEAFDAKARAYEEAVLSGRKAASRAETDKVLRRRRDIEAGRWTWDPYRAARPLVWMLRNLVFPDGEKRGTRLILEPWQIWDTMEMFGWVNEKGNRRYRDAYIEVPRKNGKSTWAGAILDYLAFSDGESNGLPCYIAATSLDQAGECFEKAGNCLALHKGHKNVGVQNSKNNKMIRWDDGRIIAVAGEPKDGKLPHGVIIDEYHQHPSNDLIDSFISGNVSDKNSLTLRITTAGTNLFGVCKKERDKCMRIVEGSQPVDNYFVSVYTCDRDDSPDDPCTWEKANPNWGVSVDMDSFKARYDYCRGSESDMVTFKTKNLNMWVNGNERWADMNLWNNLCCVPFDAGELLGAECYGGLDLSSNSDFTAFVMDFPQPDGSHRQLYRFWIPADRVMELERKLKVPLVQWVADGWITATPGAVVDYSVVASDICALRDTYDIRMIAADRWHLQSLVALMPSWFEELCLEYSQGMRAMAPAVKEFERQYMTGQIQCGGNPVMTWMMSCADAKSDDNDNVKIVKPNRGRSESRVDGVVASIMAHDTAETQRGTGMSDDISSYILVG